MSDSGETTTRKNKTGLWVVGGLLVFATGMGLYAYNAFLSSEKYLEKKYEEFSVRGADMTVDQCVDAVLEWRTECKAMESLCDSNVERMTDACLKARDREDYCSSTGSRFSDSHYTATECRAHGVDRSDRDAWKQCGRAYRAVDLHCKKTQQDS